MFLTHMTEANGIEESMQTRSCFNCQRDYSCIQYSDMNNCLEDSLFAHMISVSTFRTRFAAHGRVFDVQTLLESFHKAYGLGT